MSKKLTTEYICEFLEDLGWILLEPYLGNNKLKLDCLCPEGHFDKRSFNSFKNKAGCKTCCGNKKSTFEEVKLYIESFGYKLISENYINSQHKINILCPENHEFEVTFNNFKNSSSRCMKCVKKELGLKYNHKYVYVKEYIESFKYKLLSEDYTNNKTKLDLSCDKGHIFKCRFDSFKTGYRCKECHTSNLNIKKLNNKNYKLSKRLRLNRSKSWIKKNMVTDPSYLEFLENPNKYQIDHIIPIKAFCKYINDNDITDIKELEEIREIANKVENLQLLYTYENLNKSDIFENSQLLNYINNNLQRNIAC